MNMKIGVITLALIAVFLGLFGCIGTPALGASADGDFKSLNVRGGPAYFYGSMNIEDAGLTQVNNNSTTKTITFLNTYLTAPVVVITPRTAAPINETLYISTLNTTAVVISSPVTTTANRTFTYAVIGIAS